MTELNPFTPRQLSAVQYVLALHQPEVGVAVLVRDGVRKANHATYLLRRGYCKFPFHDWLKEQNNAGANMYVTWNRAGRYLPREE
jgi:hypothetical protein